MSRGQDPFTPKRSRWRLEICPKAAGVIGLGIDPGIVLAHLKPKSESANEGRTDFVVVVNGRPAPARAGLPSSTGAPAHPSGLAARAVRTTWAIDSETEGGSAFSERPPSLRPDWNAHLMEMPPHVPDYELLRLIGRGSYGEVWLARGVTGIFRAIKVVRRDRFSDAVPFEREFKGVKEFAAASSGEAGQLPLLHVGQNIEEGYFYYVMDLAVDAVRGRTIDPQTYVPLTLAELRERRGRIPAADCLAYGIGLARALAGLHRMGLVHRDIKPSNVILVGGNPKLADVGLVTPAAKAATFVGTEGYVPPEGPGSPSADVYALGKLLYELATGLDRQQFPQLPPDFSRLRDQRELLQLNEVIMRACEPEFEKRYHDGSALLEDLEAVQSGRPRRRFPWRTLAWPVATAAAVAVAWVAAKHFRPRAATGVPPPGEATSPASGERSVAVLPFENLSHDPENAFFTEGVHEDVLTQLTLLRGIHVISDASVQKFRGTTKSALEIGTELSVAFVLRGSVERQGNRVHVTGQLIDARDDTNVWARSYTRDLNDVFAIQAEIAAAIAEAMHVAISPDERALIERRPTSNPEAYDLYLRARQMQLDVAIGPEDMGTLVGYLQKALQLDPGFAEAWGELGAAKAWIYFSQIDHSEARRTEATQAIDRAQALAADSPAVVRSVGVFYYYAYRDYRRAAGQFEKLARLQPSDDEVYYFLGLVQRREGRWKEAVLSLRRAIDLDPTSVRSKNNLCLILQALRHYDEEDAFLKQLTEADPDVLEIRYDQSMLSFFRSGSRRERDAFIASLSPPQGKSPKGIEDRFQSGFSIGDPDEVLAAYALQGDPKPTSVEDYGCEVKLALTLAAKGDLAAARSHLASESAGLQAILAADPDNAQAWEAKGGFEAVLGNREAAVAAARKAVELVPETADAMDGTAARSYLSMVYAWVGMKDEAIDELALLLRKPSCVGSCSNVFEMRSSPWYAPLHGLPRFEALVHDPANNAPL
jgi:TolB-like protein/cytochrome c-type biogenesis protein CcmH/NrfG